MQSDSTALCTKPTPKLESIVRPGQAMGTKCMGTVVLITPVDGLTNFGISFGVSNLGAVFANQTKGCEQV